jgi:NAD(P)-dependent dehydrogenase (short-subunit alcohol dehydrogenase family)
VGRLEESAAITAARRAARRLARLFVAEGACVVIGDAGRAAEQVSKSLGDRADRAARRRERAPDVKRLADAAVARFGRLDVMFNNAASAGRRA